MGIKTIALAASTLVLSTSVNAALIGFVDNPTSNSTDWSTAVSVAGGVINSNVNFNAHSVGTLDNSFYQGSDGVSLAATGDVDGVLFGNGPTDGNDSSAVTSSGEGLHAASNYLQGGANQWVLTVSFDSAVSGFGLSIIDYFGASCCSELLTIEAFTGVNGTGSSLGSVSSFNQNYQTNNIYFMGLMSDSDNIGSIVFTDFNGLSGDTIGVDDIVFANTTVPVPAAVWLFGSGLIGLIGVARRKKS